MKIILLFFLKIISRFFLNITYFFFKIIFFVEWHIKPVPKFFNHQIDLNFLSIRDKNYFFMLRGFHNISSIALGDDVLEIGSGDGFFSYYFYSKPANSVDCIENSKNAISYYKSSKKINLILNDFLTYNFKKKYNVIIADAVIQYFDKKTIDSFIEKSVKCLKADGIFTGMTVKRRKDNKKISHHKYEFKSKQELYSYLKKFFKTVEIIEPKFLDRSELYFKCK
ncbi:MAG: hypothetical protein CMC21_01545 [Flavobacteriaceae bacterium]|nr:hypothetical protein [Flavobacteriaceae bacterium]|tara:strand:- start:1702 stop:2373 length:672 start_codon:yes stop_codon:yes gene_type:complete